MIQYNIEIFYDCLTTMLEKHTGTSKALRSNHFSTARPLKSCGRLWFGCVSIAVSKNALSKKGTLTSTPCAIHDLSALRQSAVLNSCTRRIVSLNFCEYHHEIIQFIVYKTDAVTVYNPRADNFESQTIASISVA